MSEDKNSLDDLLPLVPLKQEYDDSRKSSYRLLTDPTDTASVKYNFYMNQLDGSEDLREVLTFMRNVDKLASGSDLQTDAKSTQMILIVGRMLHGTAANAFDQGVTKHLAVLLKHDQLAAYNTFITDNAADDANPTAAEKAQAGAAGAAVIQPSATLVTLETGLHEVVTVLAPFRALARVKRFLRRNCRKPADMSIRTYVSHFLRINEEELALLPPFTTANKLDFSEMVEIWQYAIPSSWNKKLQEQGKDPVLMTADEFITATEFIESSETDFEKVPRKKDGHSSKKKKSTSNDKPGSLKYCKVHGKNKTHSTEDCKVIKNQGSDGKSYEKKPYSKNKTWNRDANKSTDKSKKDFHAFIAKAVKKELNAFASKKNKRKKELNAVDAEPDVSDEDISLKDFDYSEFDKLSFNGSIDDSNHSNKSERSNDSYDTANDE